jgi:hypothetical protein
MPIILAVIALVVSVLTFAWTVTWAVHLHRHERREKERERQERATQMQERVEASLSIISDAEGHTALEVRVYNPCHFPLYIEGVDLKYWKKHEPPPEGFLPEYDTALHLVTTLYRPRKMNIGDGRKQTVAWPYASQSCYLEPRTAALFVLPPELHFKLQEVGELPADKVWVSICTPGGEIGQISGAEVVPFVKAVLKSAEAQQMVNGAKQAACCKPTSCSSPLRVGDTPGSALYPDGQLCGTTFYYRCLSE